MNMKFNILNKPAFSGNLSGKNGIFFNDISRKKNENSVINYVKKKDKNKGRSSTKKKSKSNNLLKRKSFKNSKTPLKRAPKIHSNQKSGILFKQNRIFKKRKPLTTEVFNSFGYKTVGGMSEGVSKLNQDSIYLESSVMQNPYICLMAVMDGHGMQGHRVSGFLRLNINSKFFMNNYLEFFKIIYNSLIGGAPNSAVARQSHNPPSKPEKEGTEEGMEIKAERLSHHVKSTFVEKSEEKGKYENIDFNKLMHRFCMSLNTALVQNSRINSSLSGSTGVFVLFYKGKIVIGNVGDSRAIFLVEKGKSIIGKQVTNDHTPGIESEKKRVLASGGSVKPFKRKIILIFFQFQMAGLWVQKEYGKKEKMFQG